VQNNVVLVRTTRNQEARRTSTSLSYESGTMTVAEAGRHTAVARERD